MPVSCWWECEDCHDKFDFYKTVGSGIVKFLWRQITSKPDQQPLLRCGSCGQQALRLTFEFGQPMRRKSEEPEPSPPGGIITSSLLIKGDIQGREDLYIDGEVRGTIHLTSGRVTVGPHGNISADVNAREIVVQGKVKGALRGCDRVEVGRTGEIRGDITALRIAVEEGGEVHGKVEITRPEESRIARVTEKPSGADTAQPVAMTASAGARH
jgi:cytoskeletal protein CcmA (bactofilin family)